MKQGHNIEVCLKPEPTNPVDARAIAFSCELDGKWERIGYVVREALEAVHDAVSNNRILSVKFDWVKYIVHWRSGMGWYAGIRIAKSGEWPLEVVRCSSVNF